METLSSSSLFFIAIASPFLSRRGRRPISAILTDERPPAEGAATSVRPSPRPPPPPKPKEGRPPPPSPFHSFASSLTNVFQEIIINFIDPAAHRPSLDPRRVLADNWAPVVELPPTACPVVFGEIPPALRGGAYIRNGPNPQHLPRGTHHLFDGDGMLHSLLLPDSPGGAATLCSRFVQTYRYLSERDAGRSFLPNVFSNFQGFAGLARGAAVVARVATGQMNPAAGFGLANTSLVFFGGRLFALCETDLPYAVHLFSSGEIATLGRWDFDGKLAVGMTAHPKKDPVTGEVFAFRCMPVPPFLTFFRFDKDGRKVQPEVPIFSVRQPSFLHDFAITDRYAIFCDIQIVVQPLQMVFGDGSPVGADAGKVPRIGILPRYATSEAEMRWFNAPGFNPMHTINAWEEDDGETVVLVAPNVLSVEHLLDNMELVHSCVEMMRIDMRTGLVSRTPISAGNLDFGVINPLYQGRRNRYAYLGVGNPPPKVGGVVKLDMEKRKEGGGGDCVVAARTYGRRRFGGEPIFVPAPEKGEEEDDGYLVTYLHDENTRESSFVVMDATSPELEVVAKVALPRRVPYGFHGLFVSADEIRSQKGGREGK